MSRRIEINAISNGFIINSWLNPISSIPKTVYVPTKEDVIEWLKQFYAKEAKPCDVILSEVNKV